jgi:DNA-binding transcriptional MerR regulator
MRILMDYLSALNQIVNNNFTVEYFKYSDSFSQRRLMVKDTGVSAKTYNHWKKNGLVPDQDLPKSKRQWERLTFFEYLWIKCIKDLREFGLSLDVIKTIKEFLFTSPDASQSADAIRMLQEDPSIKFAQYKRILNDTVRIIEGQTDLSEAEKSEIMMQVNSFDKEETWKKMAEEGLQTNLFEILVIASIFNRQETGFLYFYDESSDNVIPFFDELLAIDRNMISLFYKSHVYISITNKYFQFLNDESKNKYLTSYNILKEDEHAIIQLLRSNEFREIRILIGKDNKIIETTKQFKTDKLGLKEFEKLKKQLENDFTSVTHTKGIDGKIGVKIKRKNKL